MTNIRRKYFSYITRALVPGILFLLASCTPDPKEVNQILTRRTQEDKAENVTMIYSEHGNVKARLFATEFIRNDQAKPPYVDINKGLKVQFFNDSSEIESTLTARYARIYEEKNNVLIRDSVVVVNKKGETLHTEELVWNQDVRKFYTDKFVRINTPTQVMYGTGLEANEDFSWYIIKNPKGVVQVDKSEVPE